eukprot:5580967-Amphidinium_carterae.1
MKLSLNKLELGSAWRCIASVSSVRVCVCVCELMQRCTHHPCWQQPNVIDFVADSRGYSIGVGFQL